MLRSPVQLKGGFGLRIRILYGVDLTEQRFSIVISLLIIINDNPKASTCTDNLSLHVFRTHAKASPWAEAIGPLDVAKQ